MGGNPLLLQKSINVIYGDSWLLAVNTNAINVVWDQIGF